MIESRCGITCSRCEYKTTMNCKGCISISKPFWGESCEVKSCAEAKTLNHCGECEKDIFPCECLIRFSYDKEQGDNGQRILQCKEWRNSK